MAATVPVETEGGTNQLLETAAQIGIPVVAGDTPEQPAAAAPGPAEPSTGTYERFMASFGSPARWAGR